MKIIELLLGTQTTGVRLGAARIPAGQRVYAIGDIHGRVDLLVQALNEIASDLARRPAQASVVTVGDVIDRGPNTAEVIEVLSRKPIPGADFVSLYGNHEAMFWKVLSGRSSPENWLMSGGEATLQSYGLDWREHRTAAGFSGLTEAIRAAMPPHHVAFISECRLSASIGDYLFVHAGIRPEKPLKEQTPDDLLWIREPFLSWTGLLEKVVVHGHTPVQEPQFRTNRIGIDTGAFATGRLTTVILEDTDATIL